MEQRERVLLGALAVVGLGILAWYVLLPTWNSYQSWDEEIQQNVEEIRRAHAAGQDLEGLYEQQRELERELRRLQRQLPQRGEFFELMRQLESEAEEAGIEEEKIQQFSQSGESSGDLVNEMYISANFVDLQMAQLVNLLWRFENFERIIDIRNFSISPNQTDDGQYVFDLDLELVVYIMSGEEDLEEI